MKRTALVLLTLLAASFCSAERVFIGSDSSLVASDVSYEIANQIEKEFTLEPVVWSLTDPIFRDAANRGEVPSDLQKLDAATLRKYAPKVGAGYVLWIWSGVSEGKSFANFQLFKASSGRAVWSRGVTADSTNPIDTVRSIARNCLVLLQAGEWKPFVRTTDGSENVTRPGTEIVQNPIPSVVGISSQVLGQAEELLTANKIPEAIVVLYQGIDQAPDELDLRIKLIQLLQQVGRNEEAIQLSQSTLQLFPSQKELRGRIIHSLIESNQLDSAQDQLNEALARDPNDPGLILLGAELSLAYNRPDRARRDYLRVLSIDSSSNQARIGLACTCALLGEASEVKFQLQQLKPMNAAELAETYRFFWRISNQGVSQLAESLRETIRLRRLGTANLQDRATADVKRAEALSELAELIPTQNREDLLHAKRRMAHNLLAQAASQTLTYVNSGDENDAGEAQISLSDAMRRFSELELPNAK